MTARTITGSERRRAVAAVDASPDGVDTIASTQPAVTSRNFIAISSGRTLRNRDGRGANDQPAGPM
jgi:hypothetical protein